ncbi:MAG: transporter substrate-binding domain-containing protein [Proteobacteria bacterium]|nr:transporter substrate-binding domain-containing protein [Pseudomonadota bacterium]MBU1612053.1 transporter substrate-binding domain-containing protein [Pseudomonadota bacterium]
MKIWFIRTFFLLALSLLVALPESASAQTLHLVGDAAYSPYSFNYGGASKGIDVEVVQEMGIRLGIDINLELVSRSRMMEMLKNGECDGVLALRPTEENMALALLLRSNPLHVGTYSAFMKRAQRFEVNGLEDLKGHSVGVLEGMDLGREFKKLVAAEAIRAQVYVDEPRAIGALLRGEIEAFIGQTNAVHFQLTKMGMSNTIQAEGKPLVRAGGEYLGISKSSAYPDKAALLKLMELALSDIIADGTYRRIVHRYML